MAVRERRERERRQRRLCIVEAAESIFSERGFEGTTMQQIADRAELSKATLYLYFKSKEELYLTVCTQGLSRFGERLQKAVERRGDAVGKVRAIYLAYVERSLEDPMMFRVLQDTFIERIRRNLSEQTVRQISGTIRQWLEYGARLVEEGKREGVFRREIDSYTLSLSAWRMATGLVELALLEEPMVADPGEMRRIFRKSIDLLLEGARPR
jgi:AcrR family transcriptional regulator